MDKFLNDALIGNNMLRASFSRNGELLRFFYPNIDYKQFIENFYVGIKVNDSGILYLHNDVNNSYNQTYIQNTNILQTEIVNSYFNLKIEQTDYVPIKENILVRKVKFENESDKNLKIDLLIYSKIFSNINNDTCGYYKDDALIQYNHDYSICIFSKEKNKSYQINDALNGFNSGTIGGKDYIGLSCDSSISYEIGELKPGESRTFVYYVLINDNEKENLLNNLDKEIDRITKIDERDLYSDTEKYWKKYVKAHDKLKLEKSKISDKIKNIYTRSILLFPLLENEETGGISSGMEVDEFKQKSGRYSYCWTRDAVFITKAFDLIGMEDETTKFYNVFCQKTQSRSGMWEQRFYTDGNLAPSWGYQVDETASVIIGVYDHYLNIKNKEFLKDNFKMCEKAIQFLEKYVDDVLEDRNEIQKSYDIWEEHEGVSFYSMAAIFSAIDRMMKIDEIVKPLYEGNNRLKVEAINKRDKTLEKLIVQVKEYCLKKFYDGDKKSFVRNTDDRKMDISILGAIVPFEMLSPKEKIVENTIQKINETIKTDSGGFLRYEQDGYMGGNNSWPIANLWMALYYIEIGNKEEAIKNFNFVVNTATEHGFIGEQVDNEKMEANWVIGLAWSHAMFLIVLDKLKGDL